MRPGNYMFGEKLLIAISNPLNENFPFSQSDFFLQQLYYNLFLGYRTYFSFYTLNICYIFILLARG